MRWPCRLFRACSRRRHIDGRDEEHGNLERPAAYRCRITSRSRQAAIASMCCNAHRLAVRSARRSISRRARVTSARVARSFRAIKTLSTSNIFDAAMHPMNEVPGQQSNAQRSAAKRARAREAQGTRLNRAAPSRVQIQLPSQNLSGPASNPGQASNPLPGSLVGNVDYNEDEWEDLRVDA